MDSHSLPVRRTARYWTVGPDTGANEIWIVCHGYGQLAKDFLQEFEGWNDGSRLVVAPEGLSRYYVDHDARVVGATWMTSEERLVDIDDYVAYLDQLLEAVRGRGVAGAPVNVLGFSQGTHTVSRWVAFGEVEPARVVLWGGSVPPDLDLDGPGAKLGNHNLTIVLGERDKYITSTVVTREEERLRAHTIPYTLMWFAGGHRIDGETLLSLVSGEP